MVADSGAHGAVSARRRRAARRWERSPIRFEVAFLESPFGPVQHPQAGQREIAPPAPVHEHSAVERVDDAGEFGAKLVSRLRVIAQFGGVMPSYTLRLSTLELGPVGDDSGMWFVQYQWRGRRGVGHVEAGMTHIHPALSTSVRWTWKVVSFPLIAGLLLMKPVVDFICGVMLVGGLLAAIAFEISAVGARFPFLQMAGLAVAFGLFAALYELVLMLLIED